MKPKTSFSRKKIVAASISVLQEYVQQVEEIAQQHSQRDPNFKKGYQTGERLLREEEFFQSGNHIPETKLPLWVQDLYRKLPFLHPSLISKNPNIQGQQAGQALAMALYIRDEYRANSGTGTSTLLAQARLEAGNWMFQLAERAIAAALHYPQKEALEFFEGLAQGQRHDFDKSGQMLLTDATPLYIILLLHWPEITKMKNITELHAYLEKLNLLPPQSIDLERLQKLCYRLGLRLTHRGRPKK